MSLLPFVVSRPRELQAVSRDWHPFHLETSVENVAQGKKNLTLTTYSAGLFRGQGVRPKFWVKKSEAKIV